jgi:hypothetical protein
MRARFVIVVIGIWMSLGLLPLAVVAAPMDGSAPMLCALNAVMEVNVQQRLLSSVDGARTSPITAVQRSNGRLMLQGMQNERVWGAVIDEETGRMSATVGENDGAFVISGACIAP